MAYIFMPEDDQGARVRNAFKGTREAAFDFWDRKLREAELEKQNEQRQFSNQLALSQEGRAAQEWAYRQKALEDAAEAARQEREMRSIPMAGMTSQLPGALPGVNPPSSEPLPSFSEGVSVPDLSLDNSSLKPNITAPSFEKVGESASSFETPGHYAKAPLAAGISLATNLPRVASEAGQTFRLTNLPKVPVTAPAASNIRAATSNFSTFLQPQTIAKGVEEGQALIKTQPLIQAGYRAGPRLAKNVAPVVEAVGMGPKLAAMFPRLAALGRFGGRANPWVSAGLTAYDVNRLINNVGTADEAAWNEQLSSNDLQEIQARRNALRQRMGLPAVGVEARNLHPAPVVAQPEAPADLSAVQIPSVEGSVFNEQLAPSPTVARPTTAASNIAPLPAASGNADAVRRELSAQYPNVPIKLIDEYVSSLGLPASAITAQEIRTPGGEKLGYAAAGKTFDVAKQEPAKLQTLEDGTKVITYNGQLHFPKAGTEGKQLPTSAAERISDASAALSALDSLATKMGQKEFSSVIGPFAGRLAGLNPYSAAAGDIGSDADAVAQIVGQYLEGGKMTDADIARYKEKILPNPTLSKTVNARRSANLQEKLQNKLKIDLETYEKAGYDISKLSNSAPKSSSKLKPGTIINRGGIRYKVGSGGTLQKL